MVTPEFPSDLKYLYPWEAHFLDLPDGRMHYIDEGPRDAPVLLCVHGNPTWSFYWRAIIKHFSQDFRVIAVDHLGCGLSDKPQDAPYTLAWHIENLKKLCDALELDHITLMVHDWGGAIGMGLAVQNPQRFQRFIITNTAAFPFKEIPTSIASVKIPGFGALAVRGFNAFARVALSWAARTKLSRDVKRGLIFPYSNWNSRIATLRFVQDIPMNPSHPSWSTLESIENRLETLSQHPMLIVWGESDFCFTPNFRKEWERRFPNAESHPLFGVGHYLCEDAPDALCSLCRIWLNKQ